jgi:16S rRNA (guanine527-N7)-methyltransferase
MSGLEALLDRFGIAQGSEEAGRLRAYLALLRKWNARMDLVSEGNWLVLEPLFAEALWAARKYPKRFLQHVDIGSGAGFPAVPLKILNPGLALTLIESRNKRAVFLETVLAELGLTGAEVFNGRLREFLAAAPPPWECVSWKAIRLDRADLRDLVARSAPGSQFWIFHGAELPLTPDARLGTLLERTLAPNRSNSFLSIFGKQ